MLIVGAGMAGLIAANMFRSHSPSMIEAQHGLPNNHDALLRFKSDVVSKATGIPFRKVDVNKAVIADGTFVDKINPYIANMYSLKVAGRVLSRSIWNLDACERYIAPPDFIQKMHDSLSSTVTQTGVKSQPIQFDRRLDMGMITDCVRNGVPIISTIPMDRLMAIVDWPNRPQFKYRTILAINAPFITPLSDVFQTIYYTDLGFHPYRATLCGNEMIIEIALADGQTENSKLAEIREDSTIKDIVNKVFSDFGIYGVNLLELTVKAQQYGKIVPINEQARKDFIYTMTREYGIYSLGRFATWRQILLDDIVSDASVIGRLVSAEVAHRDYQQSLETVQE